MHSETVKKGTKKEDFKGGDEEVKDISIKSSEFSSDRKVINIPILSSNKDPSVTLYCLIS